MITENGGVASMCYTAGSAAAAMNVSRADVDLMANLFEKKTHQAIERRQKSDQIVQFISDKFKKDDGEQERRQQQMIEEYTRKKMQQEQAIHETRAKKRKDAEHEVKAALDMQIIRREGQRVLEKQENQAFAEKVAVDVSKYNEEEAKKKKELLDRNKNHQSEVTKQIETRNKLLKHIGAQVLVK